MKVNLSPTDSIVGGVEPAAIGRMLAEMEREQSAADMVCQLAGEEDVEAWASLIKQWLQNRAVADSISFLQLWQQLEMPWVEMWLGLLLGGFEVRQSGRFYESDLWITTSDRKIAAGS